MMTFMYPIYRNGVRILVYIDWSGVAIFQPSETQGYQTEGEILPEKWWYVVETTNRYQ